MLFFIIMLFSFVGAIFEYYGIMKDLVITFIDPDINSTSPENSESVKKEGTRDITAEKFIKILFFIGLFDFNLQILILICQILDRFFD